VKTFVVVALPLDVIGIVCPAELLFIELLVAVLDSKVISLYTVLMEKYCVMLDRCMRVPWGSNFGVSQPEMVKLVCMFGYLSSLCKN
jgi:hypothetical protein